MLKLLKVKCLTSVWWGTGLNPHWLHTVVLHSVHVLILLASLEPILSSTLHNGQLVLPSPGAGFWGGLGAVTCLISAFFSTGFSAYCPACGLVSPILEACATADPLRDVGGVVLAEVWETMDAFREVGVVAEGSSCIVELIKLDAELNIEDPKPRTFPDTAETDCGDGDRDLAVSVKPPKPNSFPVVDSDGIEEAGCALGLLNPKPKKLDSCFGGSVCESGADFTGDLSDSFKSVSVSLSLFESDVSFIWDDAGCAFMLVSGGFGEAETDSFFWTSTETGILVLSGMATAWISFLVSATSGTSVETIDGVPGVIRSVFGGSAEMETFSDCSRVFIFGGPCGSIPFNARCVWQFKQSHSLTCKERLKGILELFLPWYWCNIDMRLILYGDH